MRLTWPLVLGILLALVVGMAVGWWGGASQDDTWRSMRDTPDDAASCVMGNAVAELRGMPPVDCSALSAVTGK